MTDRDRHAVCYAVIRERCTVVRRNAGQAVLVSTGQGFSVGSTAETACYRCPGSSIEECF